MSKSLSVLVLLPMDKYNSFDTYREDDRLKQIYSEVPKAENYFKTLRIRSLYPECIARYIMWYQEEYED